MVTILKRIPAEILIAGGMLISLLLLSVIFHLPIVYPSRQAVALVGVHYVYPLFGVAILGFVTAVGGQHGVFGRLMLAAACYIVVLFAHFNIKLWIPHINPYLYDDFYWRIDNLVRPLVQACFAIRGWLSFIIPLDSMFYMSGFIMLFYVSFLYHAIRTPNEFGRLVVAVLVLQSLGSFAYLVAPGLGPFIYEPGRNVTLTNLQMEMFEFYQQSVAHGPQWLEQYGGAHFVGGVAAMPSLHSAGAFLFFLFAWRYAKPLVPIYGFVLFFIVVGAVSSRWHYVVDVPAGLALAWISCWIAERWCPTEEAVLPLRFHGVPAAVPAE